jgi:hypothetical protein
MDVYIVINFLCTSMSPVFFHLTWFGAIWDFRGREGGSGIQTDASSFKRIHHSYEANFLEYPINNFSRRAYIPSLGDQQESLSEVHNCPLLLHFRGEAVVHTLCGTQQSNPPLLYIGLFL